MTTRRKALIPISSARELPLAEPVEVPSISTGFFLVELAQVLKEFEDTHDFVFTTPDGKVPQLDVNGLALSIHAIEKIGNAQASASLAQHRGSFDPHRFRARRVPLAERREQELRLLEGHLGRVPVSEALPKTDKEVADFRPGLVERLSRLEEKTFPSFEEVLARHRAPDDPFDLGGFDFVHVPGGHAPMVDFRDNPWFGEILHLAREKGVPMSLICHAPIALTSTAQRVDERGWPVPVGDNPFRGTKIAAAGKRAGNLMLRIGYPSVPGKRTRLHYHVDEALEEAGFPVSGTLNPSSVRVVYDPALRLLTGNGPQAIDQQTRRLRSVLAETPARV
ncbi:hypothetical protein AB0O01_35950 [Streptomyces sp. NPDC093252]|uniref:hypothetical protein n=1 Tax=Streptomyces sp. NPDC093252 TaxID=3154980 RepID=UPI00342D3916